MYNIYQSKAAWGKDWETLETKVSGRRFASKPPQTI